MNTKLIATLAIVFAAVVFTTVESSHLRVPQNKVKKELNTLENVDKILLVSEEMIISSMYMIWQRLKIIIEPSCSIVLAALMLNSNKFLNKKVGLILTGGNYDLKQIPW